MLSEANLLILDEPTNHLDITSKEILEQALVSYTGTVLFVSHDRYFINKTCTRILNLTNETVLNYIGNYDYYMEKCKELTEIYVKSQQSNGGQTQIAPVEESSTKLDWKQQKENQARKRKQANELKKTEAAIEEIELRIAELEEAFANPEIATNSAKLGELQKEYDALRQRQEALYEAWEELMASQ